MGSHEDSVKGETVAPNLRRVAAIDCGTNSTRLLIAQQAEDNRYEVLHRRQEVTRLGEGVDASRRLRNEAIDRVLATLLSFKEDIDAANVQQFRLIATSAVRDAVNRNVFLEAVQGILGEEIELLSGQREAQLSFLGATYDTEREAPYLVFDLGGGSTEFSYGGKTCEQFFSADIGCVRITEKFIHSDPPLPEELSAALSLIELHLIDVEKTIPSIHEAKTLIGLAGTVTATAMIEKGLQDYSYDEIHHYSMTHQDMEEVFRLIATDDRENRLMNPGMEEDRVDVIIGGLCILLKIMRHLHFTECLVSEKDILDGLVIEQLEQS